MTGDEIRRIRKRLGMTQLQFAGKLGVDPVTVSRWEREQARPSQLAKRQLRRLAK